MRQSRISEEKGLSLNQGKAFNMHEVFGEEFYRTNTSVKRSGPFSEPPEKNKIICVHPLPKSQLHWANLANLGCVFDQVFLAKEPDAIGNEVFLN